MVEKDTYEIILKELMVDLTELRQRDLKPRKKEHLMSDLINLYDKRIANLNGENVMSLNDELAEMVLKEFAEEVAKKKEEVAKKLIEMGYDPKTARLETKIETIQDEMIFIIMAFDNVTDEQIPIIMDEPLGDDDEESQN